MLIFIDFLFRQVIEASVRRNEIATHSVSVHLCRLTCIRPTPHLAKVVTYVLLQNPQVKHFEHKNIPCLPKGTYRKCMFCPV